MESDADDIRRARLHIGGVSVAEEHPFRTAWRVRDLDAWIDALSPDVVLHSPVVRAPFRGRDAARELYGVLFETFGEVDLIGEFANGDAHAFFWQADVSGQTIEGADRLRHDTWSRSSLSPTRSHPD